MTTLHETPTATKPTAGQPTCVDLVVQAGDGALIRVPAGGRLRIVDLHGNQAVDTLLYDARDLDNRYSAFDTVREQGAIYLSTGSRLLSSRCDELAVITDDTCGRHDTIGGACSQESNTIRYGEHTRHQHACRQTFLKYGAAAGIGQRQLTHNINFFMNVPVTPEGKLTFEDGISNPGKYVEMRAETDVLAAISNCPQLNNPCNAYNPTPVRVLIWDGAQT
jgi:urea carboxylase-associated protein 1